MDDCTLVTIYRKRNFNIYNAGNRYIVHNSKIDFSNGHTHIKSFSTAKFIIDLSLHKSIPKHLSNYLLISLIRINTDYEYLEKLHEMLNEKDINNRKGTSYRDYNRKSYMNNKKKKKGD